MNKETITRNLKMSLDNFKKAILTFPEQLKKGAEAAKGKKIKGKFKGLEICGMGGSGLPGELLKMIAPHLNFEVRKSYPLDLFYENPLVIAISYSGNTEETLSWARQALRQNWPLTCITTGGNLEKLATENNACLIKIPETAFQPRWATGFLLSSLLAFLENLKLSKNIELSKNIKVCYKIAKTIDPEKQIPEGAELAEKISKKTPLVYSSIKNAPLAYYWKIAFNENVKIQAFYNYFPELNHNEMQALEDKNKNFHIILLKDKEDDPRIKKRMEVFAKIAKKQNFDLSKVKIEGKHPLEKIANSILYANWTVYHLCKLQGIDPEPVKLVEEFKKRIKEK